MDQNEDKLLRSVALQNAQAVRAAREQVERELIAAKEELERRSLELADQREFFQVTLSSIGDAVITADTESRVTFLNPVAERMTGWKSAEVIGQPLEKIFKIVRADNGEPAGSLSVEVLREAIPAGLGEHTALIARDGTMTPIDDSAAPIRDAAGKMRGVVIVFHDVTKQREVESELRESNRSLSEARDHLENRVRERTAELRTANESLRNLSARLLQLQDDERRRLARELHDSVGQILAALSMNIAVVQGQSHKLDAGGMRAVAENAQLVQQASVEIRTLSHLLHPPLIEIAGLASALSWYVDGFSERSKIKVDLEIPPDLGRLPDDTELAIFRIVQECLTNIHRHSGSANATIRIHQQDGHLTVQVQDAGHGIPFEKQRELEESGRSGVGIGGMRERVRQLGGSLEIKSVGDGTLVSAKLRLHK